VYVCGWRKKSRKRQLKNDTKEEFLPLIKYSKVEIEFLLEVNDKKWLEMKILADGRKRRLFHWQIEREEKRFLAIKQPIFIVYPWEINQ
jgi:hypothetical protein